MKKNMSIGALTLIMAACLAACTQVYKMESFRQSFAGVDNYLQQSQDIRDEKQALLKELTGASKTPKAAPFPAMQTLIDNMGRHMANQRKAVSKVEPARQAFEDFAKDRIEITDKDPAWPQFQAVQAKHSAAVGGVAQYTQSCGAEAQKFDALMKEYGIRKVNVEETRKGAKERLDSLTARIDDFAIDLGAASSKVLQAGVEKRVEVAEAIKITNALNRIKDGYNELKGQKGEAEKAVTALKSASFKGQTVVWTGPGLAQIPGLDALENMEQGMNDLEKKLKAQVALVTPAPTPVPAPAK